jgi:hypothetical protein
LTRSQDVLVLDSLSILDGLLSHLFSPVLLGDCGLFAGHCLSVALLKDKYTVVVVVVTDLEGPLMPPTRLDDEKEDEEKPPLLLKKGSLSNIELKPPPPNPPNPPNPPRLPPLLFLRSKKLLKKSSSSWSKGLLVKNLAKRSSA